MLVFTTKESLESQLTPYYSSKKSIGFVPTMGALHEGHISLVKQSAEENTYTVVSIFVNPTQFNNTSDLKNYPRTLENDLNLLKKVSKDIIVFSPNPENLYNNDISSLSFDFGKLEHQMEGKFRPGHFNGVGTVLTHLFNVVKPTRAYFGEKDYQQLQIVKKLVAIQNFNIEIIGCKIYRETNGLAFSSRNQRLSETQKAKAEIIHTTLQKSKKMFGTKSALEITAYVKSVFEKHPLFELEYFEIADIENLETAKKINPSVKYRAFIAVFVNQVRLIDNIALN